jgi:hypothetical protein
VWNVMPKPSIKEKDDQKGDEKEDDKEAYQEVVVDSYAANIIYFNYFSIPY